jgi:hypothetical protein
MRDNPPVLFHSKSVIAVLGAGEYFDVANKTTGLLYKEGKAKHESEEFVRYG